MYYRKLILWTAGRADNNRFTNPRSMKIARNICLFALFFLTFGLCADERDNCIAQLRHVLFNDFPSGAKRSEIDQYFKEFVTSKYSVSKTTFASAKERAYWETLKYPDLWTELCISLDRDLGIYAKEGNVSEDLPFTIAQIYLFGRLEYRPILLSGGRGIDTEDKKLAFSAAIGPAIEVARFIRETQARKVFEVFSGRGNMTLLLSLLGLEQLTTIELDNHLDIEASWQISINKFLEEIPSVFWPKVTRPLFLSGDILETDLPPGDCILVDPPYGYASSCNASTATAFTFFLDVLAHLQKESYQDIYSLVPSEWVSMIDLFSWNAGTMNVQSSVDEILQKSMYYKCKPDKWAPFIEAVKEQSYVDNLRNKLRMIPGITSAKRTPIHNILGKELDIFHVSISNASQKDCKFK